VEQEPEAVLNFEIEVPDELEVGTYANFLSVWHSPHDFTLDFAVTGQGQQVSGPGGHPQIDVPCRIVARIKLPLTVVEDVLRALATNVGNFEEQAGRIRKPGDDRPSFPPEGLQP
jgi:Protein of unknown function (DUF3467)